MSDANHERQIATSGRIHRVYAESDWPIEVKEVWEERETPERPRDFDEEGYWPALINTLKEDAMEFDCKNYIVLNTGDGLFQVWREFP